MPAAVDPPVHRRTAVSPISRLPDNHSGISNIRSSYKRKRPTAEVSPAEPALRGGYLFARGGNVPAFPSTTGGDR